MIVAELSVRKPRSEMDKMGYLFGQKRRKSVGFRLYAQEHHGGVRMFDLTVTFDNGPEPSVAPRVLDVLARRGVRTTFFVIGNKLLTRDARACTERAHAEGHWIGNHTWTTTTGVTARPHCSPLSTSSTAPSSGATCSTTDTRSSSAFSTPSKRISIDHTPNGHDDLANAVAGAAAATRSKYTYDTSLDWIAGPDADAA